MRRPAWRRCSPGLLTLALAFAIRCPAAAEPIRISIAVDDAGWPMTSTAPAKAVLELTLTGACGGGIAFGSPEAHREVELTAPGTATVDLPAHSQWQLKVRSDAAVWAPEREVATDRGPIEIRVTPAIRLDAQLVFPPGKTPPSRALVRYTPSASASSAGAPAETLCPVEGGLLRCALPAGAFFLRIDLGPSLALVDRLFARLQADQTQHLGTLQIAPAVTLIGCMEAAAGSLPADTVVELQPDAFANGAPGKQFYEVVRRSARPASDGCFEFTRLSRGWFTLRATATGLATSTEGPFYVDGEQAVTRFEWAPLAPGSPIESQLPRRLRLRPAAEIVAEITPPLDPEGHRWHVGLRGNGSDWTRCGEPNERGWALPCGEADEQGRWSAARLPPGPYTLTVGAPGGGLVDWASRRIEAEPAMGPVAISIPFVAVEGLLTKHGEPRAAIILFRTPDQQLHAALASDADGRFHGFLPRDGAWLVDARVREGTDAVERYDMPIEIRRTPGASADVPVHLDLPFPAKDP